MNFNLTQSLSEAESVKAQSNLYSFFVKHLKRYTLGDSSSVPSSTASEIFTSVCFVLKSYFDGCGVTYSALAQEDSEMLFKKASDYMEEKVSFGKNLYNSAKAAASKLDNISITDTLNGIGTFFKKYDIYYYAHLIPGDIDYQLCIPVSEKLYGIDYINGWLANFLTESIFMSRFEADSIKRLLESQFSDYRETILNLYEPVMTAALGLTFCGKDIFSLNIDSLDAEDIAAMLSPMNDTELSNALKTASDSVAYTLGLNSGEYIKKSAFQLIPRIKLAPKNVFRP